jgi:hypothetical protein
MLAPAQTWAEPGAATLAAPGCPSVQATVHWLAHLHCWAAHHAEAEGRKGCCCCCGPNLKLAAVSMHVQQCIYC